MSELSEMVRKLANQCWESAGEKIRFLPSECVFLIPKPMIQLLAQAHGMRNITIYRGLRVVPGHEGKLVMYHEDYFASQDPELISIVQIP